MVPCSASAHESLAPALFDASGRRIATGLTHEAHSKVRSRFVCHQPVIDYAQIHGRITSVLSTEGAPSVEEFTRRATAILEKIRQDPQTAGLSAAVGAPFFLPRWAGAVAADIGTEMDQRFIPGVGRAFEQTLPSYSFSNHHKGGLAGRLAVATGSRHDHLLQSLEQDSVVGIYFVALPGFSLPAAVEQVAALPENFALAGGYDTSAALIGSPDLLLNPDGYPPLLWLAALTTETPSVGYHYEAYGYNLTFNRRAHHGQAAEYWASGLVVLG